MQREIMTSIPFLSQPSAAAENTEEDLAVAQDLKDTLDAHRNGCVSSSGSGINAKYPHGPPFLSPGQIHPSRIK